MTLCCGTVSGVTGQSTSASLARRLGLYNQNRAPAKRSSYEAELFSIAVGYAEEIDRLRAQLSKPLACTCKHDTSNGAGHASACPAELAACGVRP